MLARECDCKEFQDSGHTDECNNHYKKDKPMKIFYCTFSGYYPVGASAIIVAPDKSSAEALMTLQLDEMKLLHQNKTVELKELDSSHMAVHILTDGDY